MEPCREKSSGPDPKSDWYYRLFQAVPDSLLVTHLRDGRIRDMNSRFLETMGYSREELIGRTPLQVGFWVYPEDRESLGKLLLENRGLCSGFETTMRNKAGREYPVMLSARVVEIEGEPYIIFESREDSERREIRKALQESERRFREMVEMLPVIVYEADSAGRLTFANQAAFQDFGYTQEEFDRGLAVLDMVSAEDRPRALKNFGLILNGEKTRDTEYRMLKRDGTGFDALISSTPILRNEKSVGLRGVMTDITDLRKAEEELSRSEEKYRLLVENANEAILVVQDGMIQFINPKAVKIMDYRRPDLSPRPFSKFIHPEDREQVMEHYRKRLGGEPASPAYSFRLLDDQGNVFWVEINAVPISWEGQPAGLVFLTDINEKKQLEQQFLQAQKMEAVGRLAGGVAHDFNNLLTSILGHSDLMMMRLRPGDPLVGDIKEILKAANRATDLTRQLLAFSRKQVMQPRILNLNAIIADMKKMLKRLIGEDIILETLLSPTLGQVLVDPGQIDQVIMNLVVNARDAMPKGGTLTIETRNTLLDELQVRSYIGAKPGAYVLLSVKDTGSGMTEDLQSHIFEPFFTTKEMGKGTGLGLSTVYGIVKQSNGYIWVDSRAGQGTAFKIFLPQQEGAAESDLKLERGKVSLRGEETILLAEDNELVRGLTRSVLEHFGYRVLETEDGEEAGRMSKGYEGPIHLLLTDVVMPGIGGRALAEQLQIFRPGIKILFMSGYSEEAILLQGMQTLGGHFLQKPFTPEELGQRVREILDSV